ncbi:type I inositol polyphosphate 5-phosphatase 13-like isoform X2 [Zingiber officinale]|uniref:type I inositol polyphosphate 5-phosphatase 13-like isoform X2 n=1 Tax=Zingiber officinale TaxID=94328 RepID=UPI001C4CB74D|nr:type I inositol polyphosphate 5-phosphatase 13-like isoform X2 [Zingiber officinale]
MERSGLGIWNYPSLLMPLQMIMALLRPLRAVVVVMVVALHSENVFHGRCIIDLQFYPWLSHLMVGLEGSANDGQWWLNAIGKTLDEGSSFQRVVSRQLAGLLIVALYTVVGVLSQSQADNHF